MCSSGPLAEKLGLFRGKKGSGEQSSGGIGSAMAITRPPGTQRMQRTASPANFMALFGSDTTRYPMNNPAVIWN